jgi:hypothetical protein
MRVWLQEFKVLMLQQYQFADKVMSHARMAFWPHLITGIHQGNHAGPQGSKKYHTCGLIDGPGRQLAGRSRGMAFCLAQSYGPMTKGLPAHPNYPSPLQLAIRSYRAPSKIEISSARNRDRPCALKLANKTNGNRSFDIYYSVIATGSFRDLG